MSTKSFRPPRAFGAANVQIFGPDGAPLTGQELTDVNSPIRFEARDTGRFFARINPIGEESRLVSFEAGPEGPEEVSLAEPSPVPTARAASLAGAAIAPPAISTALSTFSTGFTTGLVTALPDFTLSAEEEEDQDEAPLGAGQSLVSPIERRLAVGLSYDSAPMRFGGWRPFDGPWPLSQSRDAESWTLEVRRDANSPDLRPTNARLRLHIALEGQKILRLLLPIFEGGTAVTLRVADSDVGVSIRPLDETLHVLMQAFAAGSDADPMILLDKVARTGAGSLDEDPWALVVFGLLAQRKHPDAFTVQDALAAAGRFPWMSDASIVAANLILAQPQPDVGQALSHLVHARRIGAPYFVATNALLGDLLVTLSADAPQVADRRRAGQELAIWRRRIPFQASAGPYFAWLTRGGWRNRGFIDRRYQTVVFDGRYRCEAPAPGAKVEKPFEGFPDHDLDAAEE